MGRNKVSSFCVFNDNRQMIHQDLHLRQLNKKSREIERKADQKKPKMTKKIQKKENQPKMTKLPTKPKVFIYVYINE